MLAKVKHAHLRVISSLNADFKYYAWELLLECDCFEDRRCKYKPQQVQPGYVKRGFAAMHAGRPRTDILPAPQRVKHRCPKT